MSQVTTPQAPYNPYQPNPYLVGAPLDFEFWAKLIGVGFLTLIAVAYTASALFPADREMGGVSFAFAILFILLSGVGYTKLLRRWPIGRTNVYAGMAVSILMGMAFAYSVVTQEHERARNAGVINSQPRY